MITGFDREENFELLFGPKWNDKLMGIEATWQQVRIQVLLCPPPNTKAHIVAELLDSGATRWTPRGPDRNEEETLMRMKRVPRELGGAVGI